MIRLACAALIAASVLAVLAPAVANEDSGIDFAGVLSQGRDAWAEPEGSKLTEEQVDRAATYVLGSATFILYHEFGHAMVSEFNLPVLGKQEDAVDAFATIFMVADEEDEALDAMVEEAAAAWFDQAQNNEDAGRLYDYGPHSVESQRGYQILCLLVGSDPESWKDVADEYELPADRQQNCPNEYERTSAAWDTMLAGNELDSEEGPSAEVTVVWDKAEDRFAMIANVLYASGLGDAIASQIEESFRLTGPITLQFTNCGTPNAWWIPNERTVRFCYDWADLWHQNIAYYIAKDEGAAEATPAEAEPTEPAEEPDEAEPQ